MCCRYLLLRAQLNEILVRLGVRGVSEAVSRYNIAPGTKIPAVRKKPGSGTRELAELSWGLVPTWANDDRVGTGLINARAESLTEKPSFRDAFRARRCLIPASGFYEWKAIGRVRQPWLFQLRSEPPFFLAGLWESWTAPDGATLETCAVITTEPNSLMQPIHHRMPAILPMEVADQWLEPTDQLDHLAARFLLPFPPDQMMARLVSSRVNSAGNDDEGCLEPAGVDGDAGDGQLAWDL